MGQLYYNKPDGSREMEGNRETVVVGGVERVAVGWVDHEATRRKARRRLGGEVFYLDKEDMTAQQALESLVTARARGGAADPLVRAADLAASVLNRVPPVSGLECCGEWPQLFPPCTPADLKELAFEADIFVIHDRAEDMGLIAAAAAPPGDRRPSFPCPPPPRLPPLRGLGKEGGTARDEELEEIVLPRARVIEEYRARVAEYISGAAEALESRPKCRPLRQ